MAGEIYVDAKFDLKDPEDLVLEEDETAAEAEAGSETTREDRDPSPSSAPGKRSGEAGAQEDDNLRVPGMFTVRIKSVHNLPNVEGYRLNNDPYVNLIPLWLSKDALQRTIPATDMGTDVIFEVNKHSARKRFIFAADSTIGEPIMMRFEVMDKEQSHEDKPIGFAELNLAELVDSVTQNSNKSAQNAKESQEKEKNASLFVEKELVLDVVKPPKKKGKSLLKLAIKFDRVSENYAERTVEAVERKPIDMGNEIAGILEVKVGKAENLKDKDWFGGYSDPYVSLKLEPCAKKAWPGDTHAVETAKTRVRREAAYRADFSQTFQFPYYRYNDDGKARKPEETRRRNLVLNVELRDEDFKLFGKLGNDDLLGTTVIDVSSALENPGQRNSERRPPR